MDTSAFVFTATIVRDEGAGTHVVRDVLVEAGCAEVTFVSKAGAGAIVGTDLIVLETSDMRLLRKLVSAEAPVIMVCTERDIDSAFLAGAADVVTSPVRRRELEGRVRRVLRQRVENEHRDARERMKTETIRALTTEREQLQQLVCTDPVTGLAGTHHAVALLEQECKRAARGGVPLGLVMIDVDFFQAYNEANGRVAGDACLRDIATALARCLRRPADFIARIGDDELVAVLPDTDDRGAQYVAEMMRATVEALALPHVASLSGDRVTVTAGFTCLPSDAEWTAEAAIEVARAALQRARSSGHNCVDGEDVIPVHDRDIEMEVDIDVHQANVAIAMAPTHLFAVS